MAVRGAVIMLLLLLFLLLLRLLILLRRRPLRLSCLSLSLYRLIIHLTRLPSLVWVLGRSWSLPVCVIVLALIVLRRVVVSYRRSVRVVGMVELSLLQLWLLLLGSLLQLRLLLLGVSGHACFLGMRFFVFSPLLSLRLCAVQLCLQFGLPRSLCWSRG